MPRSQLETTSNGQGNLPRSATIAFPLDGKCNRALSERTATLGMSRNELARRYILEILFQGEARTVSRQLVSEWKLQVDKLIESHALAVEALLVSAGKIAEDQAHARVKEHLQ